MQLHSGANSIQLLWLTALAVFTVSQSNAAATTNMPSANNGLFVAVGDNNNVAYSSDGITWHESHLPPGDTNSYFDRSIVYGKNMFIALPSTSERLPARAVYSSDGINWRPTNALPRTNVSYGPAIYGNGVFVALSSSDGSIIKSSDGINWTHTNRLPLSALWQMISYGNGVFIVMQNTFDEGLYSSDGITWHRIPSPFSPDSPQVWHSMTFGDGKFIMLTPNAVACSADGVTWKISKTSLNSSWFSVAYGNGVFVAVSDGKSSAYSGDGITWHESRNLPHAGQWRITYGKGVFVAVTYGTNSAYSYDGITWHPSNGIHSPSSRRSVTYGEIR